MDFKVAFLFSHTIQANTHSTVSLVKLGCVDSRCNVLCCELGFNWRRSNWSRVQGKLHGLTSGTWRGGMNFCATTQILCRGRFDQSSRSFYEFWSEQSGTSPTGKPANVESCSQFVPSTTEAFRDKNHRRFALNLCVLPLFSRIVRQCYYRHAARPLRGQVLSMSSMQSIWIIQTLAPDFPFSTTTIDTTKSTWIWES